MPFNFKLVFPQDKILSYAKKYKYSSKIPVDEIVSEVKSQGFLDKNQLKLVAKWKSPRPSKLITQNSEDFIRSLTQVSLSTESDRLRIEVLTLLKGVNYPTASAILHFCHPLDFPILDFRALYSLGYKTPPKYNYEFWHDYTQYTRALSKKNGVDMRTLDKALWQFSKDNQR